MSLRVKIAAAVLGGAALIAALWYAGMIGQYCQ
jgi:hypothetical protein